MALRTGYAVALFLFLSHLNGPAEAYLDPGTGSMALQALLGGVVGLFAVLRMYRERFRRFMFRRSTARHGALDE
jgi:hypothetical protein